MKDAESRGHEHCDLPHVTQALAIGAVGERITCATCKARERGRYVVSSVPIALVAGSPAKLLAVFETTKSFWRIFVYDLS